MCVGLEEHGAIVIQSEGVGKSKYSNYLTNWHVKYQL